jgi:OOP family OmpA-OmpF porin
MNIKLAAAIAPLLFGLAACANFPGSTGYLDELNTTAPTGPAFSQSLAGEYKAFAQTEKDEYDWMAQQLYAKKGLDAAHGTVDTPENVSDWSVDDAAAASDLTAARARLMAALATDAPTRAPALSATAQVKFECWLHEQHEGWQMDEIAECKKDFMTAMDQLEKKPMAAAPAPAPAAAPATMPKPVNYLVFFDFDKSNLSPEARKIIATAAQAIKAGGDTKIKVTGHTDTVGTVDYNIKLSFRRADAVEQELVRDGVPAGDIAVDGKGKSDLLVATGDGVREPKNRRAVIEFTAQ